MLKHFEKREPVPTELTWEEKNPTDYLYRPSEDILWLRQRVAKSEGGEGTKSTEGQQEQRE